MLITVSSPLLFLSPKVYLDELEELWTDQHVLERVWKSLMTKMLGEWCYDPTSSLRKRNDVPGERMARLQSSRPHQGRVVDGLGVQRKRGESEWL